MFAIIELGNQQFRVEKDTIIKTQLTGKKPGESFDIDKVLVVGEGSSVEVGKPYVGKKVKAEVMADVKAKKIEGFIYKKRKGYRRSWGHRQKLQNVKIVSIG